MAITITDQPHIHTPLGQRLMYVATSTNVTQENFKFKLSVVIGTDDPVVFYVPPNPSNSLIFDVSQVVKITLDETYVGSGSVHQVQWNNEASPLSMREVNVEISEAWEIGGVMTDNAGSGVDADTIYVWPATYQAEDGYKPDPSASFSLDSVTSQTLSDRTIGTHQWQFASTFGITTNCIYIPVYPNDWGVMSLFGIGISVPFVDATKVEITIFNASGTPTTLVETLNTDYYSNIGVYPMNLAGSTVDPSLFPNYRYYRWRLLDSSNNIVSANYVFYNTELYGQTDCNWDKIRIAWVGSRGGWEYFNFIKKSEESIEIERKRYNRVLGDFGATYSQNGMQRGLTEGGIIAPRYLTATSDWISEEEFVFLRGLFVSKQVHWVQADGTFIPMLVEDTQYTEQKIRDGKNKNLTVKFRYANNLWT